MEYVSVVYCPHHTNLIDRIKNLHRRFIELLHGLHDISYADRLKPFDIELLKLRRIHIDFIMLYKILNGLFLCEY